MIWNTIWFYFCRFLILSFYVKPWNSFTSYLLFILLNLVEFKIFMLSLALKGLTRRICGNPSRFCKPTNLLKKYPTTHSKLASNHVSAGRSVITSSLQKNNSMTKLPLQQRMIHTTSSKQAIPPIIWLFVKPISKLTAVLFGR